MNAPKTNPAIEAVHRYLLSQPLEQLTTDGARRVAVDLIAAVLDNLPREVMYTTARACGSNIPAALIDAAISAARATLLAG